LWLPVVGLEQSYEVSNQGRVRSIKTSRILSQRLTSPGKRRPTGKRYPVVEFRIAGRQKIRRKVHLLVLEAFSGARPSEHVACHSNDNPLDNRLENLRWDTRSGNVIDSVINGCHPQASKTACSNGHEYTPENTYLRSTGRNCRACQRNRQKKYMAGRP